jgi:hypothetical protein
LMLVVFNVFLLACSRVEQLFCKGSSVNFYFPGCYKEE